MLQEPAGAVASAAVGGASSPHAPRIPAAAPADTATATIASRVSSRGKGSQDTVGRVGDAGGDRWLGWRVLLVVLGAWSIVPPYLGPEVGLELDVASSVEFVDHVVPGGLVVVFGVVSVVLARAEAAGTLPDVIALGICSLAGFWQLATHASLWADAGAPGTPWGAVILHGTAGAAIMVLAGWLLLTAPVGREADSPSAGP